MSDGYSYYSGSDQQFPDPRAYCPQPFVLPIEKIEPKPGEFAPSRSRWKCGQCGSRHVQVSYGVWFYEHQDFETIEVGQDEGGPMYFYCENCDSADHPMDLARD